MSLAAAAGVDLRLEHNRPAQCIKGLDCRRGSIDNNAAWYGSPSGS